MARAIINEGSGRASERYAISFVGNPTKDECVYIGGDKDEAQRIVKLIDGVIDEEVAEATAERDKRIEHLNKALKKAIGRIEDIKAGYKIPTTYFGNPFDIIAEIRAIANGGSNDS